MGQLHRIIAAVCVAFQVASCAGPAALETQSSQRDGRQARIYFLREKGILGAMGGTAAGAEDCELDCPVKSALELVPRIGCPRIAAELG